MSKLRCFREGTRARVCRVCETIYASQDLVELRQLEYLLEKTAAWPGAESPPALY